MDKNKQYRVLDVIHRNGAVKKLIHIGFSYIELSDVLEYLTTKNFIIEVDEIITLSESGLELLNTLAKDYKERNKKFWIKKDEKSKVKKLNKNDIFVPNQNELDFD